jgi:hypothetical protein
VQVVAAPGREDHLFAVAAQLTGDGAAPPRRPRLHA